MSLETLTRIQAERNVALDGELVVPDGALGIVLFAHGAGSSRMSPRNKKVAADFNRARLGTLLFDLLTEDEDRDYQTRFDIELLSRRLLTATDWVLDNSQTQGLPVVLFGASTGAAAALRVAAELGPEVAVVVSRGGRPDLAGERALQGVISPTLLIVGGRDTEVIRMNQDAFDAMTGDREIRIVEGATHLFEEAGALDEVADLATEFILQHVQGQGYVERDFEPL